MESGIPEEHFIEIIPLKKANAGSIYPALVDYCREKNIQLGTLIGGGAIPKTNEIVTLICSCHNFFPLSSVQILFIQACCLLCVL